MAARALRALDADNAAKCALAYGFTALDQYAMFIVGDLKSSQH